MVGCPLDLQTDQLPEGLFGVNMKNGRSVQKPVPYEVIVNILCRNHCVNSPSETRLNSAEVLVFVSAE